ncbi:MAG: hypothetical protein ACI8WP_001854, partial [Flavobacteriaceae bacterium]
KLYLLSEKLINDLSTLTKNCPYENIDVDLDGLDSTYWCLFGRP